MRVTWATTASSRCRTPRAIATFTRMTILMLVASAMAVLMMITMKVATISLGLPCHRHRRCPLLLSRVYEPAPHFPQQHPDSELKSRLRNRWKIFHLQLFFTCFYFSPAHIALVGVPAATKLSTEWKETWFQQLWNKKGEIEIVYRSFCTNRFSDKYLIL